MKQTNEMLTNINLRSDLLNKSAVAKKLGLSQQNYSDKLSGRGGAKPFTPAELEQIETVIKNDLKL